MICNYYNLISMHVTEFVFATRTVWKWHIDCSSSGIHENKIFICILLFVHFSLVFSLQSICPHSSICFSSFPFKRVFLWPFSVICSLSVFGIMFCRDFVKFCFKFIIILWQTPTIFQCVIQAYDNQNFFNKFW